MKAIILSRRALILGFIVLCAALRPTVAASWEDWVDYVVGDDASFSPTTKTLSMEEIGEMRVRDIKRRLSRSHGYSADELSRMLDKKDLINALAFEEHKTRNTQLDNQKRYLVKRGIIAALIAVALVLFWPLFSHATEVGMVNLVVYTDRKRHEASKCLELRSLTGFVGCFLMAIVDILSFWLSVSVLLSWVMTSKYFFPVPRLSVHPAKLMGGEIASGPMAQYGLNVGPMAVSWGLRFLNRTIESWTGRALASAQREIKRQTREKETEKEKEERKARKAERKAAKQAAKEQAAAAAATRPDHPTALPGMSGPQLNGDPFQPNNREQPVVETVSVQEFLKEEFDNPAHEPEPSGLDELD